MNGADLTNCIRLELSKLGYITFRANVGKVRMSDGRFFNTGLPKGFSDLFAIKNGQIFFIEVKGKGDKPSPEQQKFLDTMKENGCPGGFAYTVSDAINICEGKYGS